MRRHYAPDDKLLTLADIAERLSITPSGAYKWVRAHDLPVTRPGRKLLVRESVFHAEVTKHDEPSLASAAQAHLRRVS